MTDCLLTPNARGCGRLIYVVELDLDCRPRNQLLRLPAPTAMRPFTIRFQLPSSASALAKPECCLYTNYPIRGRNFDRNQWHPVQMSFDGLKDAQCEVHVQQSGVFEYLIWEEGELALNSQKIKNSEKRRVRTGYLLIEPELQINDRSLAFDAICLLTVVPKWLPTMDQWPREFDAISKTKYNFIHFPPMQHRGVSNSPYSIYDQLAFSPDLFPKTTTVQERLKLVEQEIKRMELENGLLCMTDVVWNHTACNSSWLLDHPESGYNLENSPHLRAAYELDDSLLTFSGELRKHGVPDQVQSEGDVTHLLHIYRTHVLPSLKLWEFYVMDVDRHLKEMRDYLEAISRMESFSVKPTHDSPSNQDWIKLVDRSEGKRFSAKIKAKDAFLWLATLCPELRMKFTPLSLTDCWMQCYRRVLEEVNLQLYKEHDHDMQIAMQNVFNRVKYERLDAHGPKLGRISLEAPLVGTYFTRLRSETADPTAPIEDGYKLANNGWIWNADPLVDFAGPTSKSYLIREVIPWGDCVKLRYGTGPDDNPWLWNHMKAYTLQLANIFHAFRIDNCHSTPIHVAQYFLDQARLVRSNLYVVAELFTGSQERDQIFVSKLGIHSLIREAMSAWNAVELGRLVHLYGGKPVGSFHADWYPPLMHRRDTDSDDEDEEDREWYTQTESSVNLQGHAAQMTAPLGHVYQSFQPTRTISRVHTVAVQEAVHPDSKPTGVSKERARPSLSLEEQDMSPPTFEKSISNLHLSWDIVIPTFPKEPHALFMDCTHDNETPSQKRIAQDALSNAALVLMAVAASGSVRGYDQLIPKLLNIVEEKRSYMSWNTETGILPVKKVLLDLHERMGRKGYNEIHVHQEREFVCVFRQHPKTHSGYLLIANTAFKQHQDMRISPVTVRNSSVSVVTAARLKVPPQPDFQQDKKFINGLECNLEYSQQETLESMMKMHSGTDALGFYIDIEPQHFPAGSVLLFETELLPMAQQHLKRLQKMNPCVFYGEYQPIWHLEQCLVDLGVEELNVLLYRCEEEEKDATGGHGCYVIPEYGPLLFAGLEGFAAVLSKISSSNDLGSPVCKHLRSGYWALDYCVERVDRYVTRYPNLRPFRRWFSSQLNAVKHLPNYLVPKYFTLVILSAYHACINRCLRLCTMAIQNASPFIRSLSLTSFQLLGSVPSTGLDPSGGQLCLSAGLSHFSTRHLRCWGRDTFISLRGLCLVTGLYDVAKDHLLAFASCIRHGLIPNLLDSARRPRYNARDATWFFLHALHEYTKIAPNGLEIMDEHVARRFPTDDYVEPNNPEAYHRRSLLRDIVQEIMQRHASGIEFREWNAGPDLDHAMRSEGFNVSIILDEKTGFLRGGNRWNCGTWMDKMGDFGENYGVPATPRDGSPVELVGLLYSVCRWLQKLGDEKRFNPGVVTKSGEKLTYKNWADRIQQNFERCFYIPQDPQADHEHVIDSGIVNRRGIYKDTFGSSLPFTDYQLRPNFLIAMTVAPDLFQEKQASAALQLVEKHLLGPLGIKTLDPSDWAYRGSYNPSIETGDASIAHGFNYHQGPEWGWLMGYYLRARTRFPGGEMTTKERVRMLQVYLNPHRRHLKETPGRGLPELTQANGEECVYGCWSQAWSSSTILDCWYDWSELLDILTPQLTLNANSKLINE